MIGRAIYRIRQALSMLVATLSPDDSALADRWLSVQERSLFRRMEVADQRHSVRVARSLLAAGVADSCLIKAALLHDVGKSRRPPGLAYRTAAVLMVRALGHLPSPLTRECASGWRLPFRVIANHPDLGAEMLVGAGCEERVCRLVALHQTDPQQVGDISDRDWVLKALRLLQEADNRS